MKNVEDLYPLSPMQRTMMLHALAAGPGDTLFHQFVYELDGVVDRALLERAWQQVIDRHPALRTVFVWKDLPDPLQAVRRRASIPFEELDWQDVDASTQQAQLAALKDRDRETGFDFGRAPLMRVTLIRRGPNRAWMLWSSHHLVIDRWCVPIVLADLRQAYSTPDVQPPSAGRFRDYIAWTQNQDTATIRAGWRPQLAGLQRAARDHGLRSRDTVENQAPADAHLAQRTLGSETTEAIRAFAQALRITPSILAQAAWALVLSRRQASADVVFGATVAGRPPALAGVESTVGSFINNLPVRVRLPPKQTVATWLAELHRLQQERSRFEHEALPTLHRWSGLPAMEPLFRSLFVWLAPVAETNSEGFTLRGIESGTVESTFPVTVTVADGPRWTLSVRAEDPNLDVEDAVEKLREALDDLLEDPARPLSTWVDDSASSDHLTEELSPDDFELIDEDGDTAPGREQDELEMVQSVLLAEFRDLLGLEAGPEDSFFELGGSSLLAAQLHARIEKALGRSIPQLSLFQEPTVTGMAKFLSERSWPLRGEIVRTLSSDGTGTPLFCISSPEVNSIGYVLLNRYLPRTRPTYLVQAPPSSDEVLRIPLAEIQSLTQRYVAAIRETQATGPYRMLGMCGGAILALEVAKALRAQGDTVEFVGVLNTYGLYTLSRRFYVRRAEIRLRYYAGRLKAFGGLGWQRQREEMRRVLGNRLRGVRKVFQRGNGAMNGHHNGNGEAAGRETAPAATNPANHLDEDAIRKEWHRLDWPRHLPATPKFDGTVTVFRIRRQPYFRIRDAALGWGQHALQVQVENLQIGDHLDLLREPTVQQTAAAVATALAKLDRKETVG